MPCPFLVFSQSNYVIQLVDTNLHSKWQTVQIQISWLLQKPTDLDWRSQLIWIYTVSKDRTYLGSAEPGLSVSLLFFEINFILFRTEKLSLCWTHVTKQIKKVLSFLMINVGYHSDPQYWDRQACTSSVDPDQTCRMWHLIRVCTVCCTSITV